MVEIVLPRAVGGQGPQGPMGPGATDQQVASVVTPIVDAKTAGKADKDGSNVEADAFRGAIGADLAANVNFTPAGAGAVARTIQNKARETLSASDFGVVNDAGASDQTAKLQAWLSAAVSLGLAPSVPQPMDVRITSGLTYDPTAGVIPGRVDLSNLKIRSSFNGGLKVGSPLRRLTAIHFLAPSITRSGAVTWGADADATMLSDEAGLILYNLGRSRVWLADVRGFSVGVAHHSENHGYAYNEIYGGALEDNRYNEVLRTVLGSTSPGGEFVNENSFFGGARRENTASNALGNAYGTVLTAGTGAYTGHNANRWFAPCYEMGSSASATYRCPVLLNAAGQYNKWHDVRHEGGLGPFGIAKGRPGLPVGCYNEVSFSYAAGAVAAWRFGWLQVARAFGNIAKYISFDQWTWHSGPLVNHLSSGGPSTAPRLAGPLFLKRSTSPTPLRQGTVAIDLVTNTKSLQFGTSVGAFVEVDTSQVKNFRVSCAAQGGFAGRFVVQAYDGAGNALTGDATDAAWGDEPYVKFSPTQVTTTLFGGAYMAQSDNGTSDRIINVRDEVKSIHVGYCAVSFPLALKSLAIIAYPASSSTTLADMVAPMGLGLGSPVADDSPQRIATTNPATAGIHGKYSRGEIIGNASAISGAASGWVCTGSGWLASAWLASTSYTVPGQCVTNDTGKVYSLVAAGVTAASGGPTGTSASITDGTATWKYEGALATFSALTNIP